MSDEADKADLEVDAHISHNMARIRAKGEELKATGHCHWCGDPVGHLQKFCTLQCSVDWTNYKRRTNGTA